MAGVANLFALIDQIKRNVAKNVKDPVGAVELGLLRMDEDFKKDPVNTVLGSANIGGGLLGMTKGVKGLTKAPDASNLMDRLMVQHNVSEGKLGAANKLGALPVPSLAISKAESPLQNFGEVTLVGRPEMAIPSAKNPVYRSDAYTARRPKIIAEVDKAGKKKLQQILDTDSYTADRLGQNILDADELRYSTPFQKLFLKDIGALPDRKQFKNDWEYSTAIQDAVRNQSDRFYSYIDNFQQSLPDMGIGVKEKIFKGYSPSGDRRYSPATLENIVKAMRGGPSTEGFNYGVGNARAVAQPKFRNFAQVKDARGQILSSDEFKPIAKELSDQYTNVLGLLGESGRYDASDAFQELAETGRESVLRRVYPDIKDNAVNEAMGLYNRLSSPSLPTEYFEIKPQRAVGLNEFAGAILPENASSRTIDILRNAGLNDLQFYRAGDEADRAKKFLNFPTQMFSAAPLSFGLLGMDEENYAGN